MSEELTLDLYAYTERLNQRKLNLESWNFDVRVFEDKSNGITKEDYFQLALDESTADIVGFVDDDLVCRDPLWADRVLREFRENPMVGVVWFAGSDKNQYIGNIKGIEDYGKGFKGSCEAYAIDEMAFFVRRVSIERSGGWGPNHSIKFFYQWLWGAARDKGMGLRIVGIELERVKDEK